MAVSKVFFERANYTVDVNTKLSISSHLFLDVLDRHAPVKTVKTQNHAVPFVIMKQRKLWKRVITSKRVSGVQLKINQFWDASDWGLI